MNYSFVLYASVIFVVAGLFLIASGVSGMIVYDSTLAPLCEGSQDCNSTQVCCIFNNAQSGVCTDQQTCSEFLTMPQSTIGSLVQQGNASSIIQVVSGLIIVILTGFMLYLSSKSYSKKRA